MSDDHDSRDESRSHDTHPEVEPVRSEPLPRAVARFAVGSDDHAAVAPPIRFQGADIADQEWGQRISASLAAHDERWKWTKRIGVLLAPMVLTGFVTGIAWLRSSGAAAGAARERETIRADDHRLLLDLRDAIAEIRGELRAISRLGAVRIQGPAPQPLLPGGSHD